MYIKCRACGTVYDDDYGGLYTADLENGLCKYCQAKQKDCQAEQKERIKKNGSS